MGIKFIYLIIVIVFSMQADDCQTFYIDWDKKTFKKSWNYPDAILWLICAVCFGLLIILT